jgi:hypothetical protein
LHALPEQVGHKKVQFEIVCILALIAMFTHMHIFWIAGLLLAFVDFPDFSTPLNRIAGSTEKIASAPQTGRRKRRTFTPPGSTRLPRLANNPAITAAAERRPDIDRLA